VASCDAVDISRDRDHTVGIVTGEVASGRKADASAVIEFISSSVKLSGDMTSGRPWVRYIKTLPQSPKKCGLPRLGRSALALSRSRKRSDTEPGA